MVTIKLIFKVLDTFGLMERDDQELYMGEAQKDWESTNLYEKDKDGNEVEKQHTGFKAILQKVKVLEKNWLFSVGLSIASIFIIRAIGEYMQPSDGIEEFRKNH